MKNRVMRILESIQKGLTSKEARKVRKAISQAINRYVRMHRMKTPDPDNVISISTKVGGITYEIDFVYDPKLPGITTSGVVPTGMQHKGPFVGLGVGTPSVKLLAKNRRYVTRDLLRVADHEYRHLEQYKKYKTSKSRRMYSFPQYDPDTFEPTGKTVSGIPGAVMQATNVPVTDVKSHTHLDLEKDVAVSLMVSAYRNLKGSNRKFVDSLPNLSVELLLAIIERDPESAHKKARIIARSKKLSRYYLKRLRKEGVPVTQIRVRGHLARP